MQGEIKHIEIFKNLSMSSLEKIQSVARFIEKSAGEFVFQEQDPSTPICFVIKGGVRVFKTGSDGKEQNLAIINEGEVFNLPTAFFSSRLAPASASAVCKSRIMTISQQDFRRVVTSEPEIALAVMGDLSTKLEHLTNLVHDLSLKDVRSRLAKFLLNQHLSPDQSMKWTHEKIAVQIGTSREVVTRLLKVFTREGWLEINRHRINVINPAALKKIVDE